MLIRRFAVAMLSVGLLGAGAVSGQTTSTGSGQAYPSKPIRIVSAALGSGGDFAARVIAQGISGPLGQQVIIENRSGYLPQLTVSQAPPDGYTVLIQGGAFWNAPLVQSVAYDPLRDFTPITLATRAPNVLVVHPSLPVKSVKELIALAKARPGELNYTSTTVGGTSHLAAELLKSMAGINIVRVGYSSGTQEMTDLLNGQVHLTFNNAAAVTQHIRTGKLRALAVGTAEPSPLMPGVPPVGATLPGFESASMSAMFAPAKTPEAIINRLNQEIVRFVKTPEAKERFFNSGVDTVGSSPAELAATMKSEIARLGKVVREAGIRAE